jgi:hypothetical protein
VSERRQEPSCINRQFRFFGKAEYVTNRAKFIYLPIRRIFAVLIGLRIHVDTHSYWCSSFYSQQRGQCVSDLSERSS